MDYKFKKLDNENKIRFEGKCYIGDPCYVLDDHKESDRFWSEFVDFLFKESNSGYDGVVEILGHKMINCGTAYGDGSYDAEFFSKDKDITKELFVDSGSLSVIPLELIKKINPKFTMKDITKGMMVVDIKDEFDIELEGGNIELEGGVSSIRIITDGSNEPDDDY